MSIDTFNSQPDDSELFQLESGPEPAIRVTVQNPIRSQAMPNKAAATRTRSVPAGTSTQILFADHKRSLCWISVLAFPVILSTEPISASELAGTPIIAANGFPVAVGATIGPLRTSTSLFALGVGGTAVVGTLVENWAAGDD